MDTERGATVFEIGPAQAGLRLDSFLCARIPRLSRVQIQRAIGHRVRLQREPRPKPSTRLRAGDRVIVGFPALHEDPERLARIHLPVLHEDGWLLAVDKPAGLVVHPTMGDYRASVVIHLRERHPAGKALTLAHRLDRDTSGVLLLAKSPGAARVLHQGFLAATVRKRYLALVSPPLKRPGGVLDGPLGPDPQEARRCRRRVVPGGVAARTRFRVLRQFPDCSLVELWPLTGRQHQIRVHLQAEGSPVVGDSLYGGIPAPRHLLHAAELQLPHPESEQPLRIRSPLPADMRAFLAGRTGLRGQVAAGS